MECSLNTCVEIDTCLVDEVFPAKSTRSLKKCADKIDTCLIDEVYAKSMCLAQCYLRRGVPTRLIRR